MVKANLSCNKELVEVNGLPQYKPVLPGYYGETSLGEMNIQVDVLEVMGERARVLLPRSFRREWPEVLNVSLYNLN